MTSNRSGATATSSLNRLLEIMRALRDPETGCPWDVEQTFETIAPYTLEEAYEVDDAIARGDMTDLKDELGDLLLQVVFHSQMAAERGLFDFNDVATAISDKMIRRHPHVFADERADDAAAIRRNWEDIKAAEKAAGKDKTVPAHILDDVPVNLPALTQAVKLQKKAARVGFDWPSINEVIDKIAEEQSELMQEVGRKPQDQAAVLEEFGDLLFVYANLARHLKVDPERALRSANIKFRRRFKRIEEKLHDRNRSLADAGLEEMDRLWNEAKHEEKPK